MAYDDVVASRLPCHPARNVVQAMDSIHMHSIYKDDPLRFLR